VPQAIVETLVTMVLLYEIVTRDEARITEAQRDRGFADSTRICVTLFLATQFGPIMGVCLPIHFWKTRRKVAWVLVGIGAALLIFAASEGAGYLTWMALVDPRDRGAW
jgi:hypothetical protein